MFENLIPDARVASKRAEYARKVENATVEAIAATVESIELAVNQGKTFILVESNLRSEKFEQEFKDKGYSIGPNFQKGHKEYFMLSWN